MANPLVLTVTLDNTTHSFLTSLRAKYFPPNRNHLTAHITLFHAIPPHRFHELDHELDLICQNPGFEVFIGEPRTMGTHGVMVIVRERPARSIDRIHERLLSSLGEGIKEDQDRLTDQDLRPLGRPHVTVLNKARDEEQVEECLKEVEDVFERMKRPGRQVGQQVGRAVGFELWEYMGGPWKPLKSYRFKGEERHDVEVPRPP